MSQASFKKELHPNFIEYLGRLNLSDQMRVSADIIRHRSKQQGPKLIEAFRDFQSYFIEKDGQYVIERGRVIDFLMLIKPIVSDPTVQELRESATRALKEKASENFDYIFLSAYLDHDATKLSLYSYMSTFLNNTFDDAGKTCVRFSATDKAMMLILINFAENILALRAFPYEVVENIERQKQGQPVEDRHVNVLNLLIPILFNLQTHFSRQHYCLKINDTLMTSNHNQDKLIQLNCDPNLTVNINDSMLVAILYNIIKNALVAVNDFAQDLQQKHEVKITVTQDSDNTNFDISDTGGGFSLDKGLQTIRDFLKSGMSQIGTLRDLLGEIFGQKQVELMLLWPSDDTMVRYLTVGTLVDASTIPFFIPLRFNQPPMLTSNLGIWAVNYIVKLLKGSFLATNSFEGGALVSFSIPNHKPESVPNVPSS